MTNFERIKAMDMQNVTERLLASFPNSFVNANGEFIAHKKSNTYFILKYCETEEEAKCKVLEWFSRAAYKTEPYYTERSNEKFHRFMLEGINDFLSTDFTPDDMEFIYTYLGNGIRHDLALKFVESGYDMAWLENEVQDEAD